MPQMNHRAERFDYLIDINRVDELFGVNVLENKIRIGSMTRQSDLEREQLVVEYLPEVGELLPKLGFATTRNRGTVGGSLAYADPAAELPALALALDAEVELVSQNQGKRILSVDAFLKDSFATVAEPDELLTAVLFPKRQEIPQSYIREVNVRAVGRAVAGIIALAEEGSAATVTFFGWADRPRSFELVVPGEGNEATAGDWLTTSGLDLDSDCWQSDAHGSAEYRVHVFGSLLREAAKELGLV